MDMARIYHMISGWSEVVSSFLGIPHLRVEKLACPVSALKKTTYVVVVGKFLESQCTSNCKIRWRPRSERAPSEPSITITWIPTKWSHHMSQTFWTSNLSHHSPQSSNLPFATSCTASDMCMPCMLQSPSYNYLLIMAWTSTVTSQGFTYPGLRPQTKPLKFFQGYNIWLVPCCTPSL